MKFYFNYTTFLVFIISCVIFYMEYQLPYSTDISDHLLIIKNINESKYPVPGHFLYFFIVSLISGFSTHHHVLIFVSVIVLALLVTLKKLAAEYVMRSLSSESNKKINRWIVYTSTLSVFMILLPTKPPFTLPWPPISWLNSTTIFVFPLCIILFYVSYQYLIKSERKHLIYIILLSFLILISKPSYLFVFIVAFPMMKLLIEKKINRSFFVTLLVSLFIIFLVWIQYIYIYNYQIHQANTTYSDVQLIISPFSAWHRISSNIPLSFIAWFGFPIISSILLNKILFREKIYLYALINFFIALVIFILMEEVHKQNQHPFGSVNFIWQLIISLYILIISIVAVFIKNISNNQSVYTIKNLIIILIFLYYCIGGVLYLYQTVIKQFII